MKDELQILIDEGEIFNGKFQKQTGYITYYILPSEYDVKYKDWLENCRLWVKQNYTSEFEKITSIIRSIEFDKSQSLHDSMMSTLRAMLKYPEKKKEVINKEIKPSTGNIINIHNNQTQSQEQRQTQKILQEVFIEAIKDELTGKQQKEIQTILEEHKDNIEEVKPKLLKKLSTFGINVLASIVGNILTNTEITSLLRSN